MSSRRGMTLIELLVVMAIIAILIGSIATVALRASGEGPKKAARADLNLIAIALDMYKLDFRSYPPDTGFGLDMDPPNLKCDYDPGSLWRYLTVARYDPRRKKMFGPYLEWEKERLVPYDDGSEDPPYEGQSYYLADPWGEPYGFIGKPARVIHNQGSFDLWSMGPDMETAYNNGQDDYLTTGDGVPNVLSTLPTSTNALDNRAYNGKDDDGNGFIDDANEFGPEAMLNGDVGDDVNNWTAE